MGCYVPAKSAQFRITDRMFSRMGFNDSIEKNLSTFMMEVNDFLKFNFISYRFLFLPKYQTDFSFVNQHHVR